MIEVSFVMCTYNTKIEWIDRAVSSIRNQSNPLWELIVIDDGSDRENAEYCKSLSELDKRIAVYHQTNQGQSVARNYGTDHARGKWVAYIDADDWIVEDYIDQILNVMKKYDLEILSYAHDDIRGDDVSKQLWGHDEIHLFNKSEREGMQLALFQIPEWLQKYPMFFGAQWKMVYSREFLNRCHIRNVSGLYKSEDSVFNLYAVEHAEKMGYYNHVLYHYFINKESVTNSYNQNIERYEKLLNAYKEFIDKNNKGEIFKNALAYNALLQLEGVLNSYLENVNNKDTYKKRREIMIEYLSTPVYRDIVWGSYLNDAGLYKKMMILGIKKKCYWIIQLLYYVKKLHSAKYIKVKTEKR